MEHGMTRSSIELQECDNDPGDQGNDHNREKKCKYIRTVAARNEIDKQQDGRRAEDNQQQTDPVEEMEARHPSQTEQTRHGKDDCNLHEENK